MADFEEIRSQQWLSAGEEEDRDPEARQIVDDRAGLLGG
jgi:hypothetical protein